MTSTMQHYLVTTSAPPAYSSGHLPRLHTKERTIPNLVYFGTTPALCRMLLPVQYFVPLLRQLGEHKQISHYFPISFILSCLCLGFPIEATAQQVALNMSMLDEPRSLLWFRETVEQAKKKKCSDHSLLPRSAVHWPGLKALLNHTKYLHVWTVKSTEA